MPEAYSWRKLVVRLPCRCRPSTLVLPKGTQLGPPEVGLLATVGASQVAVYRRPRVAVFSTGDEIVEPDVEKLQPG